jgi:hypothetical protein
VLGIDPPPPCIEVALPAGAVGDYDSELPATSAVRLDAFDLDRSSV